MIFFVIGILVILGGLVFAAMALKEGEGGFVAGAVAVVVVGIILLILSFFTRIPTGYTGIVTTFGKVHDETLDAGIHGKAPWDTVITMDNREQRESFTLQAFSRDIQQVDITGSINLNINKSTAMTLYKEVGTDYKKVLVAPRVQEDVKIVIAKYTAEKLIENRQAASDEIYNLIKTELADKGINVVSFAIENIDFTDTFEGAVEAKQVATQEKQRAQTQQEQQTMEAQQAAERRKIQAQAEADVQKINAEAEAFAIKAKADAEAEANEKIAKSLTDELIKYSEVSRWNGELPGIYSGGNSVLPILTPAQ